ncbi:YfkD famly protein [Salirhabdus salicampi]|uniref:YfkD famly protein n=1 Tax=Salirhabdus salicampi TaxID=476102 RepID=UPI0020C4B79B|nr:YfkD famly protein [Salirhabdus salicampi]MCP8617914.1 YfkD family protein [Salirhabdus salicampi]
MKKHISSMFIFVIIAAVVNPFNVFAKEENVKDKKEEKVPSHVLNISKENTYPNSSKDQTVLEPNALAKQLINSSNVKIDNPDLIKMLNESSLKPSKLAIGYRGEIYLGDWPLNYKSKETNVNWEYQQINVNRLDNLGGNNKKTLNYSQEDHKTIKGGLTSKIEKSDNVRKMMLQEAKKDTDLPLSFETIFGKGTKTGQSYGIPPKKVGYLYAFAPAVNEKGVVTFGEVYLVLKGSKKFLEVRNVTKQGIGAWIPIQDHVSFTFQLKDQ